MLVPDKNSGRRVKPWLVMQAPVQQQPVFLPGCDAEALSVWVGSQTFANWNVLVSGRIISVAHGAEESPPSLPRGAQPWLRDSGIKL